MIHDLAGAQKPLLLSKRALMLTMLGLFLAVWSGALVSINLPRQASLAPIWLPNALVVTVLLATDRRCWPLLIAAAFAGSLSTQYQSILALRTGLGLYFSNFLEITVVSWMTQSLAKERPDFARGDVLTVFSASCIFAVFLSSITSAITLHFMVGAPILKTLQAWPIAHGLGLLAITPCLSIVAQPRRYLTMTSSLSTGLLSIATLLAMTTMVFSQSRFPILFLVPPVLLLVTFQFGPFGAAAGVLTVEAVAIISMFERTGPMMLIHGSPIEKAAIVQVFMFTSFISSLPVAVLNTRRKAAMESATKSEMKYRLLAENASDMITQIKTDGEITFITPSCQTIMGYAPEDLVGRRVLELVHDEDSDGIKAYYRSLRRGSKPPPTSLQFRLRHKDGHWVWLEGRPKLLRDVGDEKARLIQDVVRDITARKAMEFKLAAAEVAALKASQVKSEFLSNMSHELRTPLTSILGFSSLLEREQGLGATGLRSVNRIARSSQALLSIVNDILDFSKLEARQVEIHPRPIELHPLLADTLGMLEPQAEAKGLQLVFRDSGLAPVGIIDDVRVNQVLANLIGNGIKFTHRGCVSLSAACVGGRLRCEVEDTGEGISPEGLEQLFQRFSQVDASTTRVHGGTGLGLAICKGLVEAMGGVIGVRSVVGQGSTFWFELPCPQAETVSVATARGSDQPLEGLRILLADDNAANREIIRLMLTPYGIDLIEADGGEEAVRLAHQAPFDLILMDVRMPGVDGPTAARTIRAGRGPNDMVPILAVTADVLDSATADKQPSVFDDRIEKPIVPERLLCTIAKWAYPEVAPLQVMNV